MIDLVMCIRIACSIGERSGKIVLFAIGCATIGIMMLGFRKGVWFFNLIVEQVKENLEGGEHQMARDTLLLFLYYLDYEKAYAKSEQKLKKHMGSFMHPLDAKYIYQINKIIVKGDQEKNCLVINHSLKEWFIY